MNGEAEELSNVETLNLIELYEKLQTLIQEQFDSTPQELQDILNEVKNGIRLPIHIGILHEQTGFTQKTKNGYVIYKGLQIPLEDLLDEVNDRKVLLKKTIRELLITEDDTVRGMTAKDELEHIKKSQRKVTA